jgi:hypothetical protein
VQTFYPSPMATATTMYHSGLNPLKGISRVAGKGEKVDVVRGERRRRLHKAFLRYHDANNWPLLREALQEMGRADLIGNGKHHLIPTWQPATGGGYQSPRRKNSTPPGAGAGKVIVPQALGKPAPKAASPKAAAPKAGPVRGRILTQHTGLPPRETGGPRKKGR